MNWPLVLNHLTILTPVILVFWFIVRLTVKTEISQTEGKIEKRLDAQDIKIALLVERTAP